LKPFLDWVYTDGEVGRKDFFPDADRELRSIVLEIRALYGKRIGRTDAIARSVDIQPISPSVDTLNEIASDLLRQSANEKVREDCVEILDKIDQGLIVDRDVSKLLDHATALSRKEGNEWHRVMLSGLNHPLSLSSVVFHGDSMLTSPCNVLIAAELPVYGQTHKGKADIVFFVRRNISGRVVWTPIMILEVKTKTSFDFNLYTVKSRSQKDYVPASFVWKRRIDDEEWEILSTSIPDRSAIQQIESYEQGILQEYRQLVKDDSSAPNSLWKGIVLIDTNQQYAEIYQAFHSILRYLEKNIHKLSVRVSEWTSLVPSSTNSAADSHVAALISPSIGPTHLVRETEVLDYLETLSPFEDRVKDNRIFTQYVSVPSPTSYGEAAAWVSKNWHLISHILECVESSQNELQLLWCDLLGDFPSNHLQNVRMGLRQLEREGAITSRQFQSLRHLLSSICFIDLSSFTDDFLFKGVELDYKVLKDKLKGTAKTESIIVVDGWSGIIQMVPRSRRHLLEVLEYALLDSLPTYQTNIIWTDIGKPHSMMNSRYQRRCVTSLPHDSPRKTLLDEIIWNLPLAPRVFGWQAPRRVDIRVIVQDTPTDVHPWNTTIWVPHLRDWSRIFRGVSRRSRTIDSKDYVRKAESSKAMYGRSVTLSDVQANLGIISTKKAEEVQNEALSLVPALLRPRDLSVVGQRVMEDSMPAMISHLSIYKTRQLTMKERLRLKPDSVPPITARSDEKYFPLSRLTRGWAYDSISNSDGHTENLQGSIRRPPLFGSCEKRSIDSSKSRRLEIKRLLNAALFLKTQVSQFSDLQICFGRLVELCRSALRNQINEDRLLIALKDIRNQILDNTNRLLAWKLIQQSRDRLGDVLNSDNRRILRKALNKNEELLTLYGNNLFLAVIAVVEEVQLDIESPAIIDLWSVIAEWQLYQIGFRPDDIPKDQSRSIYDFQAIYSNLLWRGKQMKGIPRAKTPQFPRRYGQLIQKDTGDGFITWVVFQEKGLRRFLAGNLSERGTAGLLHGWYRCEIDPKELSDSAKEILESTKWEREPVAIVTMNETDLLLRRSQEEDNEWQVVGILEYGRPPKGKKIPIRWISLSEPAPEVFSNVYGYQPTNPPSNLSALVNRVLTEAVQWSGQIREVTCHITVDEMKEVYKIDIMEGSNIIAMKETPYTHEVVRFLRHPLRTGEYFEPKDGILLKWDVQKDIEYDEIRITGEDGSKKWIYLSFLKPLILRASFFPDSYVVPTTCQELLAIGTGDSLTMSFIIDEQLRATGMKKYLRVKLQGVNEESTLLHLESERMGIFDVALLAESSQLIDISSGLGHEVNIDAKGLLELRAAHLLHDYPRISGTLMSLIEDLDDSDIKEAEIKEKIMSSGPSLKLEGVNLEERIRSEMVDVVVQLSSIEDESDIHEVRVFSIPSYIVKSQAISQELVEHEVRKAMSAKVIEDDAFTELIDAVIECLQEEGVRINNN
jgi:hypothetical protein